ncbi:ABC-2 type transport system ATP-binding protein [Agromyces ramosus]|uniref:ABC-2 type transport system ATP-binding protein n=1 Tax=Agromyces ramosus TaxID=33879 RepID=A0A4Q7MJH5_9MICO|nr:ABC transporter ATP-binding protein [Agromyces ramosus]RZS68481.1 ABC-2 type transport system ATP-binding protein [Agromyces ramosus]
MPKTSEAGQPRIVIEGVRKTYRLQHTQSFKETFVAWIRRKKISTTFEALDDVDIVVGEGEAVALLGYNGSGKSTLLKLVSGVLRPDAGAVLTRGRVAGLIEVGAGFHPDLSGRENVYLNAAILGMSKSEIEARFDEIVEFSEIGEFIDTEVKHYSSGMFVRLAFAVAIHTELDVLLVDEVLAVGDAPFRAKCKDKIRELVAQDKTLFIVSHDLGMVSELCDRGIVLRRGRKIYDGTADEAIATLKASTR